MRCTAQPGETIGDSEQDEVAWCLKPYGTRAIPNGALHGVHFVKTPNYIQVTGVGNFTSMNIEKGDEGGELDDRGANGALLYGPLKNQMCADFLSSGRGNPGEHDIYEY
jgi:hypothetical protein